MATQAEQVLKIAALAETLTEIGKETGTLLEKVKALEEAAGNQQNAIPELVSAIDAVVAQAKVVADKVPNVEPPIEPEPTVVSVP